MTDEEADAWFEKNNPEYEKHESIGYVTFALRKRGGNNEETVGFVKGPLGDPEDTLVKRFLVKWWVGLYED